jgi:hypothetical protein
MAGLRELLFPLRPRREGQVFDGFVSNLAADRFPLEQLGVPTLVISARDDPLAPYRSPPRRLRASAGHGWWRSSGAATCSSGTTPWCGRRSARSSPRPPASPSRPDHPVADLSQQQIPRRPVLGGLIKRIRAGRLKAQLKTSGRVLEPHRAMAWAGGRSRRSGSSGLGNAAPGRCSGQRCRAWSLGNSSLPAGCWRS